jgi:tetratricopeptide (TPR) repeat protein
MRAPNPFALALAVALPALVFTPFVAAQSAKSDKTGDKAEDGSGKKHDPNNVTAISQYMEICVAGNAKYAAKDLAGAIEAYRKAIALSPKNPLGHYLLGEAQLGSGSVPEAESEWKLALESADDKNANLKAHILFVLADLKERQKKWDEARTAWAAYGDYVTKRDAGGYASTASSRQQVIDDMLRQDKLYDVVRQRIAAEKEGGAAEPSTPKPAALPKK